MPILSDLGDAAGPFGHAYVRLEEPWNRGGSVEHPAARLLVTVAPELGETQKGMTPRQARTLATLLLAGADECERSDRVRERAR